MLTPTLFRLIARGAERFQTEPNQERFYDTVWFDVAIILATLVLILIAASLAANCKDKGLNFAVVISDPLAYILGRLFFGTCKRQS
jgi:hypothetical protein